MKFTKILAMILALCLMSVVFVACDSGDKEGESDTIAASKVSVTLIIKDASGKTVNESTVTCNGTLGDAIEMYCAGEGFEGECFDATGLLHAIGDLTGNTWKAYYEDEGSNKAFDSIKDKAVQDGRRVVVSLK